MGQKVTARVSMTSNQVDPANDLIDYVDVSAGASGSKKITPNNLFTGWGMTAAGAALAKASTLAAQRIVLGFDDMYYLASITGLIGGGDTKLDGQVTAGVAVGQLRFVIESGILYRYILTDGSSSENSPYVVVPDDYNASTNHKYWALTVENINSLTVGGLLINGVSGVSSIGTDNLTQENTFQLPNFSGTGSLDVSVTQVSMISGQTAISTPYVDETLYLTASATIASYSVELPKGSDARLGQVKVIIASRAVTSFSLSIDDGGAVIGAVTALTINISYSYQCISIVGAVATWIRLS